MKRKMLLPIVILLLAATMLMSSVVYAYVYWSDNFNDNSLGPYWSVLHHGFVDSLEVNQRIESYVYLPNPGEDWMSTALQLNGQACVFYTGFSVSVVTKHYWDVQQVDLVITNNIYNPMSAHRRYTFAWKNAGGPDHLGHIYVYRQVGEGISIIGFLDDVPHPSAPPESPLAFWIGRSGANQVTFYLGTYYSGIWHWDWITQDSYIVGTDYPNMIFDTYGNLQYEYRWAIFDDFYVCANNYYPPPN
jgi:hypothetical protein